MIRVLCCGGREYQNEEFVNARLNELRAKHGDFAIIHGGARGADTLCGNWGFKNGLPVAIVNANWNFYEKKAGSLRNSWMIDLFQPNLGVAFPGGFGTRDMISKMVAAKIPVWSVADVRSH